MHTNFREKTKNAKIARFSASLNLCTLGNKASHCELVRGHLVLEVAQLQLAFFITLVFITVGLTRHHYGMQQLIQCLTSIPLL